MRLQNKVALILGASAEAGTGWAIAKLFASEGARVVVGARRVEPLEKLAIETGGIHQKCDVSNEDDVKAIVSRTLQEYGRIDICVNAAGLPLGGTVANTPNESVVQAMEVNYYGSVYVVRNVAAAMEHGGSIVLFSSLAATHPMEWVYSYACAKAAVDCLVRYAAVEYGPRGIKVNSILPGAIRSEMAAPLYQVGGMEEALAKEVPLGRIGEPEDFAEAALWLCGPSFVTGLNLQVSGGNQLTRFPTTAERPVLGGLDPTSGA